jgi:hypothetical protein
VGLGGGRREKERVRGMERRKGGKEGIDREGLGSQDVSWQ